MSDVNKPVCPEGAILSFDLKVGTSQYNGGGGQDWGYLTKGGDLGPGESTFGILTNLQSNMDIENVIGFYLTEFPIGTFQYIQLKVVIKNLLDLLSKDLEVTVNGSTYNLGIAGDSTVDFGYASDGAKQLGDLLKQNVGKTLSFCFNGK
ncbi:hypothetical protein ACP179_05930 [Xenorhabdus stockiae]|uniref:DUF7823 domain-containing protein n=1 Tax=Xenorhabdus TaxID=626 RepID=UPI001E4D5D75|nr:hypothetical protein [Xenorhabdus sp. PB30.3]MCC8379874.1 hypothetical protein [Xenorhabdus sp. PB30.3]